MLSCINLQCLLKLLIYLNFICVISPSLYIDFMSCESVIHGVRSLCMSCVLDCEVKCICAICYCGPKINFIYVNVHILYKKTKCQL